MPIETTIAPIAHLGSEFPVREISGPGAGPGVIENKGGESFEATLGKLVGALDTLQTGADAQVSRVAAGEGNLHEMAISLEKADIGMRLATKVRNKLIEAYQEIMRMSV